MRLFSVIIRIVLLELSKGGNMEFSLLLLFLFTIIIKHLNVLTGGVLPSCFILNDEGKKKKVDRG